MEPSPRSSDGMPYGDGIGGYSSFEGSGGDTSFVDAMELQTEVTELKFQNRKHVDEIADLQKQLSQTEENLNVVTYQKDNLERTLRQTKKDLEKVKEQNGKAKEQWSRELDETKAALAGCKDNNVLLRKKVARLEEENATVCTLNDELVTENQALKADDQASRKQLKDLGEELCAQYELADQTQERFSITRGEAQERAQKFEELIEKLTFENEVLHQQKKELEQQLSERKVTFDLGPLEGNIEDDDSVGPNSFIYFPPTPRNASLHAELFEAMENCHSFGITPNLPVVLGECEMEAESSPRSSMRRMNSSDKGSRPPLKRMPKAVTTDNDEAKSDLEDYQSAASSLPTSTYDSLERPLTVSGSRSRNGAFGEDEDTCSFLSEENTGFRSPIVSPSSPTYWTPSQGLSSQETLTNHDYDGDRIPVNCDQIQRSFLEETDYSGSKVKSLSWGITMPIDNRHGISSIGVIPESEQEHMKRYAYDTVARSCDRDAEILSRTEWRTLKNDLDAKELANYKKSFGQEDGGETDEGGYKTSVNMDLDDEAEEHCEKYSTLVDELFNCLDVKRNGKEFNDTDLPSISQRFEQLATVFKTDHMNLTSRSEATWKSYESALSRMKGISSSLSQCLQRIRDHKLPGEIHEDLRAMEHTSQELDMYSNTLCRTARRAGRIDLETRLFKMIEVMVLYVHILKTLHRNSQEESQQARILLEEKGTPLPSKKSIEKLHHSNNNGKTVTLDNEELDENLLERFDDGKPKFALQHLLGPKKSAPGLVGNYYQELVHPERHSRGNVLLRQVAEWYEILLRELYWPWNWDQTWIGLKQGFSGFIMIVGLLIIAVSVIPNVGGVKSDPDLRDSVWLRIFTHVSKYGSMSHSQIPHV